MDTEREPRADKVAVVSEVRGRLDAASAVLLTEYRGLDVPALAELRRSLREAGGEYKIYKNTLVRLAVADMGVAGLDELLVGPTALTFVDDDAAAVAKALRDFARDHEALVIKGGVLGTDFVGQAEIVALADLPPRDVLLARLAGGLQAPMQMFAGALQATLARFAHAVHALAEARGDEGDQAAAATDVGTTGDD